MASNQLQQLDNITKISPLLTRILGQNPGSFTLQGTNTYLVGSQSPFLLVDTGEGKPAYLPLLASCLGTGDIISDIIITHKHKDHWGGLQGVLGLLYARNKDSGGATQTRPRAWKFPEGAEDAKIAASCPSGTYEPNGDGALHWLKADQVISGPDFSLRVIHTPGHTADSICLLMEDDRSVFTADTILGQSTAVFTDLRTYLQSLRSLFDLSPTTLYPGHGPVLADGRSSLERYISHRQSREDQIVALLRNPPPSGADVPGGWSEGGGGRKGWTNEELVLDMYKDVGFVLQNAAARGVDLHLAKLEDEGRARRTKRVVDGDVVQWELV